MLVLLFIGCSTKKNTSGTRAFHELTTRYNIFFNAQETYNETLRNQSESFSDNYAELLPFYPFTPIAEKTQPGGAFNAVIEKTTKAIQEHSISAKPKRDASRPQTQEYRDWLRQQEFNPFIKNAWLLMGKAHVQNQDYDRAIEVFSQTVNLFKNETDVVSEAQIWMMRAYTESDRLFDAENMAYILQNRTLPKHLNNLFTETYTNYLLRKKEYEQAIPHLIRTIDNEPNFTQKKRLQFLLGQIYSLLGDNNNAFKAFEDVKGLNTPYKFTLNAIISQSVIASGNERQKMLRELEKMSKSSKNEEYLDKIYFAIGNIYLHANDTTNALKNYLLAEKQTSTSGLEKTLAQIALGDIYFNQKEFVKAEPRYTGASSGLPKTHADYKRVSFRSEALKELVPHASAVQEQDSIRRLANLPRNEQLVIINAHISELKKMERAAERDSYLAEQQNRAPQISSPQQPSVAEAAVVLAGKTSDQGFYFYNPQLVAQGRTEFQRIWGNRTLTDNWRLLSAASGTPSLSDTQLSELQADSSPDRQESPQKSTDPLSPEFYLQQLPTTAEAIAASDSIIESGLYNVANIVTNRLQDFDYAIKTYNRLLHDFPKGKYTPSIYYKLYLIHLRNGNNALAQTYKNLLTSEYPENENAVAMMEPDFENNIRNYAQQHEALYQKAYQAYRKGNSKEVQSDFNEFRKKFPNSDLLPEFMLLNALSFAQIGDSEKTETHLKELIEIFPESNTIPMAKNIVDGLSQGKTLATNASVMGHSSLTKQTISEETISEDTLRFNIDKNSPHLYLFTFAPDSINKNTLLFAVANFNFSNFQLRTFQLSFVPISDLEVLQVKGFRSFSEALHYNNLILNDTLFLESVPAGISPIIISEKNFEAILLGENWNDYRQFYTDSLGSELSENIEISAPLETDKIAPAEPEKVVPLQTEDVSKPDEQMAPRIPITKEKRTTPKERQTELEQKEAEATKLQEETAPQKSRDEILKQREHERQEKIKQRNNELRERQQKREAELKQREREREQKLREQERTRKENIRKREQQLRQRNK